MEIKCSNCKISASDEAWNEHNMEFYQDYTPVEKVVGTDHAWEYTFQCPHCYVDVLGENLEIVEEE